MTWSTESRVSARIRKSHPESETPEQKLQGICINFYFTLCDVYDE